MDHNASDFSALVTALQPDFRHRSSMRLFPLIFLCLLFFGCDTKTTSDSTEAMLQKTSPQAGNEDYAQEFDYAGVPSEDVPKVGEDFRAQENGAAEAKIVGGTKVEEGEFLDTVGVASRDNGVGCTGVLIASDVVLTAAHCVTAGYSDRVHIGRDRDNWQAEYKVFGVEHGFMGRHLPPDCSQDRIKCGLDIAVLLLEEPIDDVRPRSLASDDLVNSAISYRAVGFGRLDRNARVVSRFKREARVTAVSNDCNGMVRSGPRRPTRTDEEVYDCEPGQEIVAGQMRGRTDTCNGDSGGPLLVGPLGTGQADSDAEFALAGLTSRATSQSLTACGDGGVYERLNPNARAWINDVTARLRASREEQG